MNSVVVSSEQRSTLMEAVSLLQTLPGIPGAPESAAFLTRVNYSDGKLSQLEVEQAEAELRKIVVILARESNVDYWLEQIAPPSSWESSEGFIDLASELAAQRTDCARAVRNALTILAATRFSL